MTIKTTTLPNGLRIVTDFIPHVDSINIGVWIKAGTRYEEKHYNGVAHFLEHMAFKGTERRTAHQIAEEVERVGGYLNAYTSRETTAYYARVLKEDLGIAVDILTDILQHSTFDPREMELERTVILQEIGQSYDTPDDILFDYFQDAAYPNQPVGWPILGPAEIIQTMPRQTLMDFMHGHYHPSRMVVAAAGNVDHAQLCDLVAKHYTVFNTKVPAKPLAGIYKGGDKREQRTLEQLHLALGFKGVSMNDDNYFTANLYSNILGNGMASRLFQEIREKRGLVYTIYSFLTAQEDTGVFGVYAGTSSKDGAELLKVLHDELQKSTHTLTEAELDRAKRQTKAGLVFAYESPLSRVKRLAYHLLMYDRIIDLDETVGKIEAVTLDGVHACAKEMLATPTTFAAVGPLDGLVG